MCLYAKHQLLRCTKIFDSLSIVLTIEHDHSPAASISGGQSREAVTQFCTVGDNYTNGCGLVSVVG